MQPFWASHEHTRNISNFVPTKYLKFQHSAFHKIFRHKSIKARLNTWNLEKGLFAIYGPLRQKTRLSKGYSVSLYHCMLCIILYALQGSSAPCLAGTIKYLNACRTKEWNIEGHSFIFHAFTHNITYSWVLLMTFQHFKYSWGIEVTKSLQWLCGWKIKYAFNNFSDKRGKKPMMGPTQYYSLNENAKVRNLVPLRDR